MSTAVAGLLLDPPEDGGLRIKPGPRNRTRDPAYRHPLPEAGSVVRHVDGVVDTGRELADIVEPDAELPG